MRPRRRSKGRAGWTAGWACVGLFGATVAGCYGHGTQLASPPTRSGQHGGSDTAASDELTLGAGDTFEVRVFGEPDLSGVYKVATDGTIDYPLVGQIVLEGLDPHRAAAEIARRLGEKFLRHPQVSILVKEQPSKRVNVTGWVQKEGTYPYVTNMTIVDAIAAAGGFQPIADRKHVRLTRLEKGEERTEVVNMKAITDGEQPNITLRPGDIIHVTDRPF